MQVVDLTDIFINNRIIKLMNVKMLFLERNNHEWQVKLFETPNSEYRLYKCTFRDSNCL